ncbi:agenet domain containing protein [Musa troglodytarum]|uniref:Agenet domain containing protein n=1 Tax=Musa troglodytarum TaxID=320322 RepID=A0A9E7IBH8_9LILI|nr:agenet domain containing protein [Musa troglodytarum]
MKSADNVNIPLTDENCARNDTPLIPPILHRSRRSFQMGLWAGEEGSLLCLGHVGRMLVASRAKRSPTPTPFVARDRRRDETSAGCKEKSSAAGFCSLFMFSRLVVGIREGIRFQSLMLMGEGKDVQSNPVMIYMKGLPDAPRCGFSALAVKVRRQYGKTSPVMAAKAGIDIVHSSPPFAVERNV